MKSLFIGFLVLGAILNGQAQASYIPGSAAHKTAATAAFNAANSLNATYLKNPATGAASVLGFDPASLAQMYKWPAFAVAACNNQKTLSSGMWSPTAKGTPLFDLAGSPVVYCGVNNAFYPVSDEATADLLMMGDLASIDMGSGQAGSAAGLVAKKATSPKGSLAIVATGVKPVCKANCGTKKPISKLKVLGGAEGVKAERKQDKTAVEKKMD